MFLTDIAIPPLDRCQQTVQGQSKSGMHNGMLLHFILHACFFSVTDSQDPLLPPARLTQGGEPCLFQHRLCTLDVAGREEQVLLTHSVITPLL